MVSSFAASGASPDTLPLIGKDIAMSNDMVYFGFGILFSMFMDILFSIATYFLNKAYYYRNLRKRGKEV